MIVKRTMAGLTLAALLLGAACSDDDEPGATTTVPATSDNGASVTTGTVFTNTSEPTSDTSEPQVLPPNTSVPDTTIPAPGPGDPCEPGTVDCVEDAWDDGIARLIVGYDECAEAVGDGGICTDLDQDGHAGYPDSR